MTKGERAAGTVRSERGRGEPPIRHVTFREPNRDSCFTGSPRAYVILYGCHVRRRATAEIDLKQLDAELHHLVAKERGELVHFLRRLDLFDREGGCVRLAYRSLFQYLVESHHMSEPTAWRRSNAVRLLREFPQLEQPIADGRIGLTAVGDSAKEADRRYRDAQRILLEEARGSVQEQPLPL